MLKECAQSRPGNVIVSPLSVSTALTLLLQASNGKTFEELKKGLHLNGEKATIASAFLQHYELLQRNTGDSIFSIANKIYVKVGYELNKNFQEMAVRDFKSGVESLNFTKPTESAQTINQFVEEKTNGKIKNLIQPDAVDSDTRSILVNAIYFKGNWQHKFNRASTKKGDFYISEREKVSIDYMHAENRYNFAYSVGGFDASALEMKYANSKFSFVIILPTNRTGLGALEEQLKNYDLSNIIDEMYPTELYLRIPKFEAEFEIKLNDVLKNVRIYKDAFVVYSIY